MSHDLPLRLNTRLDAHVVSLVVAHVPDAGVHLPGELGHMGQHADCPGHAAPGVEHQVLAVVSPQQLHVLRHPDNSQSEYCNCQPIRTEYSSFELQLSLLGPQVPDGADKVDGEEEEEGGGHGPYDDHQRGQGLDPQEVGVTMPD